MKENKTTNETGNNPETEQEKEVLPSFFQTLKTSTSKPLPNREVLEYNIMHSAPVKTNTEGYRSMTKVDKRTAEDIKHRLPCITPSVQLKGSSKKLTDFRKETYWLMLDYDDVPPKNIAALRQKARKIPFTMVFYITISGKGFRILLRYMRPEGCNLTATELHLLAIRKAMSMYDKLLGISCDKQCQDMVRSCGLLCIQGTSFSFIGPIISAGLTGGLSAIFGACIVASSVEMLISRVLKYTRRVITPLVSAATSNARTW